jgi:hypothetical protein
LLFVEGAPAPGRVQSTYQLPLGTVLPVRLENSISLKDAAKGQVIQARIMQEVPLPDRDRISTKAWLKGIITDVTRDSDGPGGSVTLVFTQLEDHELSLSLLAGLRAIASAAVVRAAQVPFSGADTGSPTGWANTVQIGGDVRYGDGGPVKNKRHQKVGKALTNGGVLVRLSANPQLGCDGAAPGDNRLQATWVFSADACGYYGMPNFEISHDGVTDPLGEIILHFDKAAGKLENGDGLLLRVLAAPQRNDKKS